MPISPRVFHTTADQKSDLGRTVYANSITLTPGTVSIELEGDELMGRVLQHEIDHLNGVLFIDHISALKRTLYKKKLKKKLKSSLMIIILYFRVHLMSNRETRFQSVLVTLPSHAQVLQVVGGSPPA